MVSAEANCDAGGMTWELVAPTEIDETVAMISPGHSAGALLALGRELARDPRLQEVVGERVGLRSGPASILAPPSDEAGEEVLRRVNAELTRLRDELGEQHELNGQLLAQNDQLRRENDDLKEQVALPAELEGLEFPRDLFASLHARKRRPRARCRTSWTTCRGAQGPRTTTMARMPAPKTSPASSKPRSASRP